MTTQPPPSTPSALQPIPCWHVGDEPCMCPEPRGHINEHPVVTYPPLRLVPPPLSDDNAHTDGAS